jgi:O-antigen/teichoic acid export membrane protein
MAINVTQNLSRVTQIKRILQSNHFRAGVWSVIIQTQLLVIQLVTGIILARMLGPSSFGTYSFALAIVTLIQVMPTSGLDNVIIRYSAQYRARHAWALLSGLWRASSIAACTYGFVSAAALLGAISVGWLPKTHALSPSAFCRS